MYSSRRYQRLRLRQPLRPGDVPEGMIYVDHRSVELFERIPDTYLAGAT
jgi:hypothetical protein